MIADLNLTREELKIMLQHWIGIPTMCICGYSQLNLKDYWFRHYENNVLYEYPDIDSETVSMMIISEYDMNNIMDVLSRYGYLRISYVSGDRFYLRLICVGA